MQYRLNLLPWRQKQYRQRFIVFSIQCLSALICFIGGYVALLFISESFAQQYSRERANLQQLTGSLQQINHQTLQLRHNYLVQEKQLGLPTEKLKLLLAHIATLPLEQGELVELSYNNPLVILKGHVATQSEFEQLQQFLSSNSLFEQVKLTHFQSVSKQIMFQFEMQLVME